MSGTDVAYAGTRKRMIMRGFLRTRSWRRGVLTKHIVLRFRYAVSGTLRHQYGVCICYAMSGTKEYVLLLAMRCPVLSRWVCCYQIGEEEEECEERGGRLHPPIVLRLRYAISGTAIGYPDCTTLLQCDVWYWCGVLRIYNAMSGTGVGRATHALGTDIGYAGRRSYRASRGEDDPGCIPYRPTRLLCHIQYEHSVC
eukprot:276296-Rhodomonas_salina.3